MSTTRRYSLDNKNLCYLTFYLNGHNDLESVSFDVEAADDYHYQTDAGQLPGLCEFMQCQNSEEDIVTAFAEQLKTWNNPIEIAELYKNAGIKYQVHAYY